MDRVGIFTWSQRLVMFHGGGGKLREYDSAWS